MMGGEGQGRLLLHRGYQQARVFLRYGRVRRDVGTFHRRRIGIRPPRPM